MLRIGPFLLMMYEPWETRRKNARKRLDKWVAKAHTMAFKTLVEKGIVSAERLEHGEEV